MIGTLSRERTAAVTIRLFASILLLAALLGHAQSTANSGSADISPARMRLLLHGMGFQSTGKSSGDSAAFALHFNGHSVTLLSHAKIIQLSACFEDHVAPIRQNQWNLRTLFHQGLRRRARLRVAWSRCEFWRPRYERNDRGVYPRVLDRRDDLCQVRDRFAACSRHAFGSPGRGTRGSSHVAHRPNGVVPNGPEHEERAALAGARPVPFRGC